MKGGKCVVLLHDTLYNRDVLIAPEGTSSEDQDEGAYVMTCTDARKQEAFLNERIGRKLYSVYKLSKVGK